MQTAIAWIKAVDDGVWLGIGLIAAFGVTLLCLMLMTWALVGA